MKAQGGDLPQDLHRKSQHFFQRKLKDFHGFNRRILKEDAKKNKDHQHMNSPRNKKNTFLGDSAGALCGMVKSQHQHGHGENETLLKVANVTSNDPEQSQVTA